MFSGDWGCQLPAVGHTWHCGVLEATAAQLLAKQSNRHQNHLTDRNNELHATSKNRLWTSCAAHDLPCSRRQLFRHVFGTLSLL